MLNPCNRLWSVQNFCLSQDLRSRLLYQDTVEYPQR